MLSCYIEEAHIFSYSPQRATNKKYVGSIIGVSIKREVLLRHKSNQK